MPKWPARGLTLGTIGQSVGAIRRRVRSGGAIVIDDAYLLAGPIDFPGYGHLLPREQTLAQLTSHGDRVVAEHLVSRNEMKAQNHRYQASIEQRANALANREPRLATQIDAYLAAQRLECRILEDDVQAASWLLARA